MKAVATRDPADIEAYRLLLLTHLILGHYDHEGYENRRAHFDELLAGRRCTMIPSKA